MDNPVYNMNNYLILAKSNDGANTNLEKIKLMLLYLLMIKGMEQQRQVVAISVASELRGMYTSIEYTHTRAEECKVFWIYTSYLFNFPKISELDVESIYLRKMFRSQQELSSKIQRLLEDCNNVENIGDERYIRFILAAYVHTIDDVEGLARKFMIQKAMTRPEIEP